MEEKREGLQRKAAKKIVSMSTCVEELKEKTWELDTSTLDSLVFYGIKEDENDKDLIEAVVKEVSKELLEAFYANYERI